MYFPKYFGEDIVVLDNIRAYKENQIRKELDEPVDEILAAISSFFLEKNRPKVLNPVEEDCVTVNSDKSFEDLCAVMEDQNIQNPKSLSCFEFYAKIEFLEKKAEAMKAKNL